MQFVKTNVGLVNLAFVQRIDRNHEGRAILYFPDRTTALSDQSFEDFEGAIGTYLPDHTGTQHMVIGEDQGKVYHILTPVVGWQVSNLGARPIYAAPDDNYLVYPNGYVDSLDDRSFDSVKDALTDFAATTGADL